jgi:hypothetical protein
MAPIAVAMPEFISLFSRAGAALGAMRAAGGLAILCRSPIMGPLLEPSDTGALYGAAGWGAEAIAGAAIPGAGARKFEGDLLI